MAVIVTGEDYQKHFDLDLYLRSVYDTDDESMLDKVRFVLRNLHDGFANGTLKGKMSLDIGSGPSITCIISASMFVDEIYMSDYAQRNIDRLIEWQKGKVELQTKQVEYVCEMENKKQSAKERISKMREKLKKIVHFNVNNIDSLTGSGIPDQFDVITSCWCLTSAAQTTSMYEQCIRNIYHLLKPAGCFFLFDAFGAKLYTMENKDSAQLFTLSESELIRICTESGFNNIKIQTSRVEYGAVDGKEKTLFAMTAYKPA